MKANNLFLYRFLTFFAFFVAAQGAWAQGFGGANIHGNLQMDLQSYSDDPNINATQADENVLLNSYLNLTYTNGKISAGIRFEGFLNPLQGFDSKNNGVGFPYRFVSYTGDELEITAGNFYEQFGNGLIFRTYEDKNLGYDNAVEGLRLKYKPHKGIQITALAGRLRSHFSYRTSGESLVNYQGLVRGADAEIGLNETFAALSEKKTRLRIGASFVSKFQPDADPIYKLPENVGAFAGRFALNRGAVSLSAEIAHKINDPSADNGYIYKNGNAFLLNFNYSKKGFGLLLSAKRVDNMSFRADRNASLNNLNINFLPAIAKTHTYSLAAIYPYATQPNGEVGFQADVMYKIKKGSTLGGKYGTNLALNFSRVNSLKTKPKYDGTGYEAEIFAIGDEIYFQDMNLEINKKISRKLKLVLKYLNIKYNKSVVEGISGSDLVLANIGIADLTWKIKPRRSLRIETQALFTQQDMGDWAMALLEYTIAPRWFFSVYDLYNYGNPNPEKQVHYYNVAIGFSKGATRFRLGYGKQREGIICVGGVCRSMPAANGFQFSVTSSF